MTNAQLINSMNAFDCRANLDHAIEVLSESGLTQMLPENEMSALGAMIGLRSEIDKDAVRPEVVASAEKVIRESGYGHLLLAPEVLSARDAAEMNCP